MSVVVSSLLAMGARILTAGVVEKLVLLLAEQLVKRSASKVDDRAFAIIKEALTK